MARQSASKEGRPVIEGSYYVTKDVHGNEVKVPFKRDADMSQPVPDADGNIPEFVNISGRVQQMCVQWQETDTIIVPRFGILRGEQWRIYAEPSKAYGLRGPFMERRRRSDGSFDSTYLLDEDQLLDEVKAINSWKLGPKRLKMLMAHGKIQTYSKMGHPEKDEVDLMEDRPKVLAALQHKVVELERIAKENMAALTGQRIES